MKPITFLFFLIGFSLNAFSSTSTCEGFYSRMYNENSAYGLQAFKITMDHLDKRFSNLRSKLEAIGNIPKQRLDLTVPLTATDKKKILEKASLFLKSDIRITFFKLQSLARIYAKHYDLPFFEAKLEFFKKFEDLIGKVDLWHTMWDLAQKIEEPRLQDYFLDLKIEAARKMLLEMEGSDLIDNSKSVFAKHLKDLKEFEDWKKPNKDLAVQYKQIAKELRKLDVKVKAREFTNDDIELGLHELRRRLRWPLIHTQVFNRLTKYDTDENLPMPIQSFYKQLETENSKILKSSFLKIDSPDIENPIVVPLIPYAMMTELVSMIGTRKDKAEGDIYFAEAMSHLEFTEKDKARVEAKILKATDRTEKFDHKALSDRVQADLDSSGLLRVYADLLEKLND